MLNRRDFTEKMLLSIPLVLGMGGSAFSQIAKSTALDLTDCDYAPPGEYIKDHSFVFKDGWYHLFSISGTQGYYHGYNGNEETASWSISKDLVNREMRGHMLHAQIKSALINMRSGRHSVSKARINFMFYTKIIHPTRPLEYKKLGHDHLWVYEGHKETQGLTVSKDLTYWDKISDFNKGIGIPGRDSFVMYDAPNDRYLLYSTLEITKYKWPNPKM
jgi:hypothetical protein